VAWKVSRDDDAVFKGGMGGKRGVRTMTDMTDNVKQGCVEIGEGAGVRAVGTSKEPLPTDSRARSRYVCVGL